MSQIFTFHDRVNDKVRVQVEKQPDGYYYAIDVDNWEPGFPIGSSKGVIGAIAELRDESIEHEFWPASFASED